MKAFKSEMITLLHILRNYSQDFIATQSNQNKAIQFSLMKHVRFIHLVHLTFMCGSRTTRLITCQENSST